MNGYIEQKPLWRRILCRHRKAVCWRIIEIGWDGECTVQCQKCGAVKRK